MTQIPSDNHVRDMLDAAEPGCFHARFPHAVEVLEAGGGFTALLPATNVTNVLRHIGVV